MGDAKYAKRPGPIATIVVPSRASTFNRGQRSVAGLRKPCSIEYTLAYCWPRHCCFCRISSRPAPPIAMAAMVAATAPVAMDAVAPAHPVAWPTSSGLDTTRPFGVLGQERSRRLKSPSLRRRCRGAKSRRSRFRRRTKSSRSRQNLRTRQRNPRPATCPPTDFRPRKAMAIRMETFPAELTRGEHCLRHPSNPARTLPARKS